MKTYTDPRLLDQASAVESRPDLPLDWDDVPDRHRLKATGTDDEHPSQHVHQHVQTPDRKGVETTSNGRGDPSGMKVAMPDMLDVSGCHDNRKDPPSSDDCGSSLSDPRGTRTPVSRMRT